MKAQPHPRSQDDAALLPTYSLDHLEIIESSSSLTEATLTPRGESSQPLPSPRGASSSSTPLPSNPAAAHLTPVSIPPASQSYVSSASSTTGLPSNSPFTSPSSQSQQQQPVASQKPPVPAAAPQYPPSPKPPTQPMTTINNSSPRNSIIARKDSEEAYMNIPPVHPFFHQQLGAAALTQYDSDGRDGR